MKAPQWVKRLVRVLRGDDVREANERFQQVLRRIESEPPKPRRQRQSSHDLKAAHP